MLLEGQVALVTGAGRGIGRGIALALAREGASVAVTGRNRERLDSVVSEVVAGGGQAQAWTLDVADDEAVTAAVDGVLTRWGRIDILVNNAGIIIYDRPIWSTTVEEWDALMRVNLRGTFLCCRAVAPHMVERGSGVIINIGSSSGRMADDDYGPYAVTKWGVVGYTASMGKSLRPHGVRVNGINPGWVDTDMTRAEQPGGGPEWSTPEDIGRVALFLAAHAPWDMTGQSIDVFGT